MAGRGLAVVGILIGDVPSELSGSMVVAGIQVSCPGGGLLAIGALVGLVIVSEVVGRVIIVLKSRLSSGDSQVLLLVLDGD